MRLLDQIWQFRQPFVVDHPKMGRIALPGPERLAGQIANAELRYVLRDEVARACATLVYIQPDLLIDSLDLIRLPAETMWIEWFDRAITRPGVNAETGSRRAGIYVLANPGGRSGTIRSAWEYQPGFPDRSPAEIEFNLDEMPLTRRGDPFCHPVASRGHGMFGPLRKHMRVRVDEEWATYYRATSCNLGETLDEVEATVSSDILFLFAFCLLFTMRGEIETHRFDLERLNQARSKRRQPALLPYQEVGGSIFNQVAANDPGRAGESDRAPSRLHHVRGHFVRRKSAIFWRSPHLRGDSRRGMVPPKVVRLGFGQAPAEMRS